MRYPFRLIAGVPSVPSVGFSVVLPEALVTASAPVALAPAAGECPPQGVLLPAFMASSGVAYAGAERLLATYASDDQTLVETATGHFYVFNMEDGLLAQSRFAFKLFGLGASETANWSIAMATHLSLSPGPLPFTINTNKALVDVPYRPDFLLTAQPWGNDYRSTNPLNENLATRCAFYVSEHTLWIDEWADKDVYPRGFIERTITISGTARTVPFSASLTIRRDWPLF